MNIFKKFQLTLGLSVLLTTAQGNPNPLEAVEHSDSTQTVERFNPKLISYAFGYEWGASIYEIKNELDIDELFRGMQAALSGDKSEQDIKMRRMAMSAGIKKIRESRNRATRKVADNFFKSNANRKGIMSPQQGVQYEVVEPGEGAPAGVGERVKLHFTANSLMGVYLHDTYQLNKPVDAKVGEELPALTEVITLMPIGSKYKIYLHPDQWSKYDVGSKGVSQNDVLIYEVEILAKLFNFEQVLR